MRVVRRLITALALLLPVAACFAFVITPYEPSDTVAAPASSDVPAISAPVSPAPASSSDVPAPASAPAPSDLPAPAPPPERDIRRMTREELFRRAFGRAAPARARDLIVTLFSDDRNMGRTELVYDADFASFRFISSNFAAYLDSLVLPEERAKAGDSTGYFSSAAMQAAGYALNVDDITFELRVEIPGDAKRIQRTNLQGGYSYGRQGEEISPAFFSFYLNYALNGGAYYSGGGGTNVFAGGGAYSLSRQPVGAALDGAAMMYGWAFETSGGLSEPSDWARGVTWGNVSRGEARFVRDIVPLEGRLRVGEVGMNWGGGALAGLHYEKNSGIFGRERDDGNKLAFYMPRAGEVDIYMDGVYRQRLFLPAGRHELRGFGGIVGENSMKVVLRMVDGSTEEISYDYMLGDPRNLAAGETRYAASAGFRRDAAPAPQYFVYDWNDPAVSAEYAYGLARWISAGAAGAASRRNGVARAQVSLSLGDFGWTSFAGAANRPADPASPAGGRADASYSPNLAGLVDLANRLADRNLLPPLSLSARGYYQSAYYNQSVFAPLAAPGTNMAGASGNLGFGLYRGNVTFTGGVNWYRGGDGLDKVALTGYNYGVRVSQNVWRLPVSASAGMVALGDQRAPYFYVGTGHSFGLGLNYSGAARGHSLNVSSNLSTSVLYDPVTLREIEYPDSVLSDSTFDGPRYEVVRGESVETGIGGSAEIGWEWTNGGYGVGAQTFTAAAGVPDILNPAIPGFGVNMRRAMNRGNLTAGYSLAFPGGGQSHAVSASLSGALMMADGVWALGRQTNGGFILVDARYGLKGARVHIDRSQYYEQDYSRGGWLGAAYKADVTAYVPASIAVTLSDLPPGAVLENNLFYAVGGYKQGFALRLGSRNSVMLEARVTDRGAPLAYTYAAIAPEGDLDKMGARATFTSGDGVLQMNGLFPGETYRISFGSGIKDVIIEIPGGEGLIYEVQEIAVERE